MRSRVRHCDQRLRAMALACALTLSPAVVTAGPPAPVIEHSSEAMRDFVAARAGGDSIAIVVAARRLNEVARATAGPAAAQDRFVAAEALADHGAESEALAILNELTAGTPVEGRSPSAYEWRYVRQRALVLGARLLECSGHLDVALEHARHALELDPTWIQRETVREALRIVARLARAQHHHDEARAAILRLINEAPNGDVRAVIVDAIEFAVASRDVDSMPQLLDEILARTRRSSVRELQAPIARLRIRIARSLWQHGDPVNAELQINAIRAAETALHAPLYESAALEAAAEEVTAYDDVLRDVLRVVASNGVRQGLSDLLRVRLDALEAIRARLSWYRVTVIDASARLRESAIHEAVASLMQAQIDRCLSGASVAPGQSNAQAARLEVAADRVEAREPQRAATLRAEALVIREHVQRSGCIRGPLAVEWHTFVASQRRASRESVSGAGALSSDPLLRNIEFDRAADPAHFEVSAVMGEWISRALRTQ